MLFTRCPDCRTTFRITADALSKAAGQVRCGRCACVFDAYSSLREQQVGAKRMAEAAAAPSGNAAEQAPPEDRDDPTPATAPAAGAPGASSVPPGIDAAAGPQPAEPRIRQQKLPGSPKPDPRLDATDSFEGLTVADVIAEVESGADDGAADDLADTRTLVDAQVDVVLDKHADDAATMPEWHLLPDQGTDRVSRRWLFASAAAALLLALQITHAYRAEIAGKAIVGPMLQEAYALLGSRVIPRWDLEQYAIVDWVATAEPNSRGQGSLKITARIQNKGPRSQPHPHVHVRLMDRWESAVGSRIFEPDEYLTGARSNRLMAPGATVRAELDVVDPGPDAYGFELDVCVESDERSLRCGGDAIFPSM